MSKINELSKYPNPMPPITGGIALYINNGSDNC